MGTLFSTDLDERLRDKNVFNFLSTEDRGLVLDQSYSFIVLSDTHITPETSNGFENIFGIITCTDKFIVLAGDITDNGNAEALQKFIDISRTFPIPCYPVLGNHDIYFGNWQTWRDLIGSSCYAIGGVGTSTELIVLDSAGAFFGGPQLDWLALQLKNAPPNVFVFTHNSLFLNPGLDWEQSTDWTDTRERAKFLHILGRSCRGVFMGHLHKRVEQRINTVSYVAIEDYKSHRAYCRVHVSPQGISYEFNNAP
jgi:3',5'-cyclic AMP phosphodiesterase CpdA